jgi:two-component system sensor histidine kinase UhpB
VENAQLYQEVSSREQARGELLQRLINAQEEERRRVARDLHDDIGQLITALIMSAARAEEAMPPQMSQEREKLARARSMAEQALGDLRRLILELRPEVLDDLGLLPAIRWYVKDRLQSLDIKTQVQFQGFAHRPPRQIELLLFRVIQEAITNIARHAQARTARIRLEATASAIKVLVEDDGKGFEAQKALGREEADVGAWGLRGMRERLALIGGSLHIDSQPGKGTRISMEIPWKEKDEPDSAHAGG